MKLAGMSVLAFKESSQSNTGESKKKKPKQSNDFLYLPAHVWRLPFQNVLGEWRWLQFVLVKGKLVNHHGLTVHAGETHRGVRGPRWLGAGGGMR